MSNEAVVCIKAGDDLPELHLAAVNRTMLALFAGASGDHNPIHIDIDFARRSGMPDVFAQGMLLMAWVARVLTTWTPQSHLRKLQIRFVGIAHLGNVITCRGRVAELLSQNGERCARVEVSASNQYGQVKIAGEAWISLG